MTEALTESDWLCFEAFVLVSLGEVDELAEVEAITGLPPLS